MRIPEAMKLAQQEFLKKGLLVVLALPTFGELEILSTKWMLLEFEVDGVNYGLCVEFQNESLVKEFFVRLFELVEEKDAAIIRELNRAITTISSCILWTPLGSSGIHKKLSTFLGDLG